MSRARVWWQVGAMVTAGVLSASTGFSAQWLRTAVDPTCAVIEKAEYDASRKSIRITGRSTEAVTLRVYEKETNDTLVVARHAETGKWNVEFDLVGANATPGMVVVQGISGCAALRMVTDDSFGQAPQTEDGTTVATLDTNAAHGRSGRRPR